jgi:hypothetical protein
MSTSTTSRGSSILQHLSATKKVLQDVTVDARYVRNGAIRCAGGLRRGFIEPRPPLTRLRSDEKANRTRGLRLTPVVFQFDVLEREAFEVLRLVRLWRNTVAPVNQVPPEILALVPDFWDKDYYDRDRDVIALTHVCRAWRVVFISRPSLWTNLDCKDRGRTRVYLERAKSLPINLSLRIGDSLPPSHPFFEVIPHAIGRLKSLSMGGALRCLEGATDHLSHPAPLLQKLSIRGDYRYWAQHNLVLAPTLFDGDLSSLRVLKLESVHTELPWRNMVNLTSLLLAHVSVGKVFVKLLLDFLENAPHLREVDLLLTPTSGAQSGRLVSLACLERMKITGGDSAPLLLDHLLIPVGADLKIEVDLPDPPIKDQSPRFLDNLRNFPNFTDIHLHMDSYQRMWMQFSGPNGRVGVTPRSSRVGRICLVLESLDNFDTSTVERLEVDSRESPPSDTFYRALLPMKHLRTLTLHHCTRSHIFVHALHPTMSSSGVVVCPELEELVIVLDSDWGTLEMKGIIGVAAARASSGARLKSIRIIGWDQPARTDMLELEKHVLDVKWDPEVDETDNDSDDSDEED